MDPLTLVNPHLTPSDHLVLQNLLQDLDQAKSQELKQLGIEVLEDAGNYSLSSSKESLHTEEWNSVQRKPNLPHESTRLCLQQSIAEDVGRDGRTIRQLRSLNNPAHEDFEPTVFVTWDLRNIILPSFIDQWILQPYIRWATTVVRNPTDVVMLTDLILYFTTSVPSALFLYYHFSWFHGILHSVMQVWYAGSYTLMMHQHIHMRGILVKKYAWFDHLFPYITDSVLGHTWNSYYITWKEMGQMTSH